MQTDTVLAMVLSLARQGLTVLGAILASHGYLSDSQTSDFVGGGLVLVSIVWGVWAKHTAAKKTQVIETVAAKTGETRETPTPSVEAKAEAVIAGKALP